MAGWLVLLTLALLIWHLGAQVMPMFTSPSIERVKTVDLPKDNTILQLGDISFGNALVTVDTRCALNFLDLPASSTNLKKIKTIPELCSSEVKSKNYRGDVYVARVNQSGLLRLEKMVQVQRQVTNNLALSLAITGNSRKSKILKWDFTISDSSVMFYAKIESENSLPIWKIFRVNRDDTSEIYSTVIGQGKQSGPIVLDIDPVLLPSINQYLYVSENKLVSTNIITGQRSEETLSSKPLSLHAAPGHRSLLIYLDSNYLQKWSIVNLNGALVFKPIFSLQQNFPVQTIHFHRDENVALITPAPTSNIVGLINYVTGETLYQTELSELHSAGITQSYWQGKTLYLVTGGALQILEISAISSVNSTQALWHKIQYEGYAQPEFIWQTTYASDNQESKYSLVPLVIGSLKASFLALLIAVPLAILSALYTGFFAPEKLRNWMKPTIEMLEAIPSVVIGFIAAIWLAPLAEHFLLSVILFILLIPFALLLFAMLHGPIVNTLPQHMKHGWELPIVAIILLLNALLAFKFGDWLGVEGTVEGDSLVEYLGLYNFDKSTLVVALALGLAITPSIYSLAEDAIFEVPNSLKKASYALGATRLQTLRRVVLTLAYPGILSAVTLGLGRAFGETMIVLMVTGNTPIADLDLLSGIRTMTANLAIELPESEVGSSHYQVLFYTALILFVFTFIINTVAEGLRQWLRKNYQSA